MTKVNLQHRSELSLLKVQFMFFLVVIMCIIYALLTSYGKFDDDMYVHQLRRLYHEEIVRCEQKRPHSNRNTDTVDLPENKDKESLTCYHKKSNSLPDISDINPRPGKSIFFHETSCRSFDEGKVTINARQACAVESAARLNPNMDVFLLYSSPGVFNFECDESDLYLQALLSYENIHIMHVDYEKYTKGTPVETLYSSGIMDKSQYAIAHASDITRYLTLWKYGGIYLDLDVVVIKSLENLKPNFAGLQSEVEPGAGVLSFDPTGDGHVWVESILNDLKEHFTGQTWSDSSVGVLTRLLVKICGTQKVADMVKSPCRGYTLYPEYGFYPIPYPSWGLYFDKNQLNYVLNKSEKSYAVHMWNKLSTNRKINIAATNTSYLYFARKYCPKVFDACSDLF